MPHKRSIEAQQFREMKYAQRRDYNKLVFEHAYQDFLQAEVVSKLTYDGACEMLGRKYLMVLPEIINVEKGEVLIDSRGNGSYQRKR